MLLDYISFAQPTQLDMRCAYRRYSTTNLVQAWLNYA